ncbi:MAG TPA: DUF1800 domain-containing protein [Pyrinomonadaceae bacterium]|nr:DUF1800 domain-containing protein [Pyrinomonadaceae bacterium]
MKILTAFTRRPAAKRAAALAALLALVSNSLLAVPARGQSAERRMTEEQRAAHVLNRLAFGPRPGELERVRRMGVEAYIEQQLEPSKIDDAAAEARLRNLPTLGMTNSQLLARYPQPGQLLRRLQRSGQLPPELASLVQERQQGQRQRPAQTEMERGEPAQPNQDAERMVAEAMRPPNAPGQAMNDDRAEENPERRAQRRAILDYMRDNGLESPARIMGELAAARILRAAYSERQLQEVMVDFWSNHFNVFAGKGADRWFLTSYDRDVIRPNALGNFRQLLGATAKSPAMLFYLDNFQSVSPNAQAGRRQGPLRRLLRQRMQDRNPDMPRPPQPRMRRGINENYARELMELHTLGVEGGYTQKDVQEVARAFTGWTIFAPRGGRGVYGDGEDSRAGTFNFNARAHDAGEKTVLGQKIPSGGGVEDGEKVLDILARHPSTAKFIATKLARKFVSDNPSPATIARAAEAFRKSDGDIKTTLRAVFSSPEFNSPAARRAKIKTPFELAVSAIRALGAETDARPALIQWVARMGEPLYGYQPPTGYPDTAEHWVNTGALLERMNFALALAANRIPGTRVELARFVGQDAPADGSLDQKRAVEQFLNTLLQGDISPRSREVLTRQLGEQPGAQPAADETATQPRGQMPGMGGRRRGMRQRELPPSGNPEVARIAALILGSPEFQRQ